MAAPTEPTPASPGDQPAARPPRAHVTFHGDDWIITTIPADGTSRPGS